MLKNKKGFTLSELLAVLLIVGILATIAMPAYKTSTIKTRIANNMPLMRALQNDMVNYYNLHGKLPTKLTQLSINKSEFSNLANNKGTHTPTRCTFTLSTSQISMDCGQGWTMDYKVEATGVGYTNGERTIHITGTDNASSIRKAAAGFGWQQKSGSNDTYIIE